MIDIMISYLINFIKTSDMKKNLLVPVCCGGCTFHIRSSTCNTQHSYEGVKGEGRKMGKGREGKEENVGRAKRAPLQI